MMDRYSIQSFVDMFTSDATFLLRGNGADHYAIFVNNFCAYRNKTLSDELEWRMNQIWFSCARISWIRIWNWTVANAEQFDRSFIDNLQNVGKATAVNPHIDWGRLEVNRDSNHWNPLRCAFINRVTISETPCKEADAETRSQRPLCKLTSPSVHTDCNSTAV